MDSVNFEKLCNNIRLYIQNEKPITMEPVVTNGELNSLDLRHFGWNIGKAFGIKRIHTATFIKNVFAHTLRDLEISTIERKMSHTESECYIKLQQLKE